MASIGLGYYVVFVRHVGDSKASNIYLVLEREPRFCKTWFPPSTVCLTKNMLTLPPFSNYEETGLTFTVDDLTWLKSRMR
jgi:hypothetical protein